MFTPLAVACALTSPLVCFILVASIPVKFAPLPTKLVAVIVPFVSMRAFSVPLILKPKTPFPILLIFVSAPILIPASPR